MRKMGSYLIKSLFILLFIFILSGGFVLYLTGYTPATTLSGAYVKETLQLPESRQERLATVIQVFNDMNTVKPENVPAA